MMKLDYYTMLTCETAYNVRNMNKRECVAWLIEAGLDATEAKRIVKNW